MPNSILNGTGVLSLRDPALRAIAPTPVFGAPVAGSNRNQGLVQESYDIYRGYRDAYTASGYRRDMEDDWVFGRLGRQYTDSEEKQLNADKAAPLGFNHCRRIGEQYIARVAGRTPRMTAMPRMAATRAMAQIQSDLLAYNWHISRGLRVSGMVVGDMVFRGSGALYAYVDPNADYGRGDVKFSHLSPMIVYWDPTLRDPWGDTAEHVVVSQLIARARLAQMFPDRADAIALAATDKSDEDYHATVRGQGTGALGFAYGDRQGPRDDQLRLIERYTRVLQDQVMVLNPENMEPIGLFEAKDEKKIREFVGEYDRMIRAQFPGAEGIEVPFRKVRVWRIHRVVSLTTGHDGGRLTSPTMELLADDVMPLDRYPVIPAFNIDGGNPFAPSEIRDLKRPQEFFNVLMIKLLKQVQGLAGGGRTFVHEESGSYQEMLEKQALPNAVIKWRGEAHQKPTIHPPTQISEGLLALAMTSKGFMDGVSGMDEGLQGAMGSDRESARLRSIRGEEAQQRPDQKLKIIEGALEELGRVLVQLNQAFYTGQKVFALSDTAGEIKEFAINQGMGTGGADAGLPRHRSISGETLYGSINTGAYSVVVAPGSTKPTNRAEHLQEATALATLISSGGASAEIVLDSWDHPKAEEYKQKFAAMAQFQGQIEQLKEELSQAKRRLFVADNETQRAREQKELEQFRGDIETKMAQFEGQLSRLMAQVQVAAGQGRAQIQAVTRVAEVEARSAAREAAPKTARDAGKQEERA